MACVYRLVFTYFLISKYKLQLSGAQHCPSALGLGAQVSWTLEAQVPWVPSATGPQNSGFPGI